MIHTHNKALVDTSTHLNMPTIDAWLLRLSLYSGKVAVR